MRSPNARDTAGSAITVREALALDCMRGARIVAGADGAGRRIRGVNVMEDANIVRWMRGGELLLTTGYTIRDDPAALERLVPALAERDLAGLVIKLGLYVDACPTTSPRSPTGSASRWSACPRETMFDDVLSEVLGTILNRQAVELERSSAIHARLTQVAVDGGSFTELAEAVSELARARSRSATPRATSSPRPTASPRSPRRRTSSARSASGTRPTARS